MKKVKRVDSYNKLKALNILPELLELLRKHGFTVKETEAFLGRDSFTLMMDYIFSFYHDRGDNESIKIA